MPSRTWSASSILPASLAVSDCSSLIVMTTGTGTKTLDFPDSGPHDVIVRIGANPWKAATPTYTLKLEAR